MMMLITNADLDFIRSNNRVNQMKMLAISDTVLMKWMDDGLNYGDYYRYYYKYDVSLSVAST